MPKKDKLKVAELFAGVGGFRLGLEGWKGKSSTSGYTKRLVQNYETVWSNQWEPGVKVQHASDVYKEMFGIDGHSNEDIATVPPKSVPKHDLLVGGFPCQDYSVAKQLGKSKGIEGKKGVLWWSIRNILEAKKPKYALLENVDRLIKSPANQRGRDFAIILASLADLDYMVEWRVINAADYGMPQRRRRVFIFAYHKSSPIHKKYQNPNQWIAKDGVIAKAFRVQKAKKAQSELFPNADIQSFDIKGNLVEITENFNKEKGGKGIFENSGVMINRQVWTTKTEPDYDGPRTTLKDILVSHNEVSEEFYLGKDLEKWEYLKGAKKEERKKSNGETFYYVEGPMKFPDSLDMPARTIITSEGGSTPSRFKHVIKRYGKYRRLVPVELEKANMFPENHTALASDTKRSFFMGNALVVGVIEHLGKALFKEHIS
jgi:DNA (cytosine-5)-methyltransferase 1